MTEKIYDLIIIGGGPAGITAGIYALRQKLDTLLITKIFGGQVLEKAIKIENYPGFEEISGKELIERFKKQLMRYDIKIEIDEVKKIKKEDNVFIVETVSQKQFKSFAVIVATGAEPRMLKVKGEKEFLGKGVSYCVTCDGPLFKEKKVAVIGGGNAGFEAAIFLANFASKIYILEFSDKARADKENQELAQKTGKIELILKAKVKEIRGEKLVQSLIYQDLETGEDREIFVDGVFIEIGRVPATFFLKDLVDFNEKNEILVEPETTATKTLGLFAAGDCNQGIVKQIVTACGEGAKAAISAYNYLQKLKS
jgi:thioredoxin-disulfide reductase